MALLASNEDVVRLMLRYLGQADLRSVCLVHPGLRALAEPRLYSEIDIFFYRSAPYPIVSLLRSILRRPELAAHIRLLSCYGGDKLNRGRGEKVPKMPMPEVDLRQAVSLVEETCLPFRDEWVKELRLGTLDAYLALVLSRLPRLELLHLSNTFFLESSLIGLVFQSILCGPRSDWLTVDISSSLSELRRVGLSSLGVQSARNLESVLPFFYLPSVEVLNILIDGSLVHPLPWPTTPPPSALNLTSLYIAGGKIREAYLGQILAAVPRLRSLEWQWRCEINLEGQFNSPLVNLDQLMPALAQVKETLTELKITGYNFCETPARLQGSARALAGFDRLNKLYIPLLFLTGFELPLQPGFGNCLPRNLEDLTLTGNLSFSEECNDACVAEIATWLADVGTSTPRLRKLCLLFKGCQLDEVLELARRAGLEVTTESPCPDVY